MEYRTARHADHGFQSEDAHIAAQREQIQQTMWSSGPNEILDTMVVFANICEQRAIVFSTDRKLGGWYLLMGKLLRGLLQLASWKNGPGLAQENLENPVLYFPDVEHMN